MAVITRRAPDRISVSFSDLIESLIHLGPGQPFKFDGRAYLRPIYDACYPELFLQFSRQTEKSTLLSNFQLGWGIAIPSFGSLYVTPDYDKVKEFSKEKLAPKLNFSPLIKKHFYASGDETVVNAVLERRLSNGSRIVFRSLFNTPDRARGLSVDAICYDEVQDIDIDAFPVVDECVSHSEFKFKYYSGTPKSFENSMEVKWRRSTQNEWLVKCDGCNHHNYLDMNVIGVEGPVCVKCQKGLRVENGQWVQFNKDGLYPGYRVCQLMVPWIDWKKDIRRKLEEYSYEKFMNEVLALAADSSDHPVHTKDIMDCCDSRVAMIGKRPPRFNAPAFAGVDWGSGNNSYTVLVIGAMNEGKLVIPTAIRYVGGMSDPLVQIKDIAARCAQWNVQVVACDAGFGWTSNQLLKEYYGYDKVVEVQYTHTPSGYLSYNKATSKFFVNRDKTLARLFNGIKLKKYVFPRWEEFRQFASDLLVIFSEYSDRTHTMRYDHPEGRPDDFAHALNLCALIAEMGTGEALIHEVASE